jgi:exopolyphosphatase/guanosine-5'-triphosphate,3'-diphosphate pyrophosphatase
LASTVAGLDIGTNTVLLLVARSDGAGRLETIVDRSAITRLGRGLDRTEVLDPLAVEVTLAAVRAFVAEARALGAERIRAVGTSALRDAGDGAAFLEAAARELGSPVEVVSGAREAELTFSGALHGLALEPGPVTIVDIGGGSTEIASGRIDARDGAILERALSVDVGSVRLFERHLAHDPPEAEELAAVDRDVHAALAGVSRVDTGPIVGVAGTFTTLAALAASARGEPARSTHGATVGREALDALVACLASSTIAERAAMDGVDAGRADVIVVGARVAAGALAALDGESFVVSHGGVRVGLVEEMLAGRRS